MRTRPDSETKLTQCRERVSQLETVFKVTSLLNTELDLEQLLNKIMRAAKKVMAAEVAALALIDEEHGDLVFQIAFGEQGSLIESLGGLQRMKLAREGQRTPGIFRRSRIMRSRSATMSLTRSNSVELSSSEAVRATSAAMFTL